MPVLEYRGPFDTAYGECDHCGVGSNDHAYSDEAVVLAYYDPHNTWVCSGCYDDSAREEEGNTYGDDDVYSDERETIERYSFETDFAAQTPRMLLPVLENRPQRLVSIEQEVASGGEIIARLLYDAGFAATQQMVGYHTSSRAGGFCAVERDASVDGEIVYGKLRLDTAPVALQLENALGVVRKAIQDGFVSLDARCGFHVHVAIQGFGMDHVENLYHLWNHLEDTVYRIASANWSDHRTRIAHTNYARDLRKGLTSRRELGQYFENTRETGLNLSNYLAARGYCNCGAFSFGAWSECTCDLPKATAEFRVFNGTANLRKVHAYTALSLAIVEHAQSAALDFAALPAHGFGASRDLHGTDDALRMIFTDLPLTDDERNSLRYCVEHSNLSEKLPLVDSLIPATASEV
jgi:hypothetical protein